MKKSAVLAAVDKNNIRKLMQSKPLVLQIAIPTPLRKTFDYLPSKDIAYEKWQLGQRVIISFGKRQLVGVIVGISGHSDYPYDKLKVVDTLVDDLPLIDGSLLSLYQWASDYYQHPIGDVILGTLPKKIRDGHCTALEKNTAPLPIEKTLPDFELTAEQENAVQGIAQANQFQPFLLAGVTGSGKTEVYLRVIADVLKKNQQALMLVPEISLTPQTVARFEARFHVPVLLLHSGLTDSQRCKAWLRATQDTPCIVIGTRSAVFAPLKKLGVIILDEEHDLSFKQQSGFRYSARDVAVMRAKLLAIPIILGSATPALESLKNVAQKKYQLFELTQRAGNACMPKITLHNICGEQLQQGLSATLIDIMRTHLNAGNQVLLFLNRRGYAPVLICHHCGFTALCPHCDARMTLHDKPKRLLCHHCGHQAAMLRVCPSCKQSELVDVGLGTEQLEENVSALFPDKKICRMDRDVIKNVKILETTLAKVHAHEVDILIGTQMLVKGHHFEQVTLVAALDVDHALFSSDFRAIERLGQSMIQVAGRAGRAEKRGEVFVQTHHPDHPLLKKLFQEPYFKFAQAILDERLQTRLPPYVYMTLFRAEGKSKERVHAFLLGVKNNLSQQPIEIMGPFPSAMEKKAGVYRAQLFLQSGNRNTIKQSISHFLDRQEKQKKLMGVKWIIDVDPMEV
ncbi:MAG: primosomal protein N' [Gammaproteobacteria bacterium CG_4_10_14_0_8_um_filter_38_16]|nr:MAG: primosomal protein N' [Gammaproteobacteria bacterium CG_4_10_14_0_8_um_filter_38_16]PJA03145.1 MAG: primosomal protein N' [Gammaproteobacteria bacterium CG_4_10_14_0_2_um_filter_38_22]PJB10528.1 MAG: primosomal protein N' [Gammaproteobacteria bacterium CG_4_9_14_3_um_filter_38_9]